MTNKKKRYRVKRMQNKEMNDKSLMKHKVKNLMKVYMPWPSLFANPYVFSSCAISSRVISPVEQTQIQAAYELYNPLTVPLPNALDPSHQLSC